MVRGSFPNCKRGLLGRRVFIPDVKTLGSAARGGDHEDDVSAIGVVRINGMDDSAFDVGK